MVLVYCYFNSLEIRNQKLSYAFTYHRRQTAKKIQTVSKAVIERNIILQLYHISFYIPLLLCHHSDQEEHHIVTFPEQILSLYTNKSAKELHGQYISTDG